jgi:hypothetical protein
MRIEGELKLLAVLVEQHGPRSVCGATNCAERGCLRAQRKAQA